MAQNKKTGLDALFRSSARVYSTESGKICPNCDQPIAECLCRTQSPPEGDGIVRLHRETKGRKGKGVTLIKGVLATPMELKALAKELKARCGTGGTVKDGVIEIQGDFRDLLLDTLTNKGYQVKKSGG
ncbi:translation initiation factor Sui1 [Reinekea sp.]|jgi:translation initiation factor 1|uniref:translation initiation factor Sui1 n=1 Tax=Reinekea sp. TaxID=1970455 RepID=UPI002A7F21C2|nr:translation initiation factor Sui1 [Reinekea sp.]